MKATIWGGPFRYADAFFGQVQEVPSVLPARPIRSGRKERTEKRTPGYFSEYAESSLGKSPPGPGAPLKEDPTVDHLSALPACGRHLPKGVPKACRSPMGRSEVSASQLSRSM